MSSSIESIFAGRQDLIRNSTLKIVLSGIANEEVSLEEIINEHKLDRDEIRALIKSTLDYVEIKNRQINGDRLSQEERYLQIRFLVEAGFQNAAEIAQELGLAKERVRLYASEAGISLTKKRKPRGKTWCIIEPLIDTGITLQDIGDIAGITRDAVRLQINKHGEYSRFRKARDEKPIEVSRLAGNINFLIESGLSSFQSNIVSLMPWPEQMAFKYIAELHYKSSNSYPHETLVTVFTNLEDAERRGIRKSLRELGEGTKILNPAIANIVKRIGRKPMYGSRERIIPTNKQYEAIERARDSDLSCPDIAYFVGVKNHIPNTYYLRTGGRNKRGILLISLSREHINASKGSQIYNYHDAGFTQEEIMKGFKISERAYQRVMEERPQHEEFIIKQLRLTYPDEIFSKPYLTQDQINRLR